MRVQIVVSLRLVALFVVTSAVASASAEEVVLVGEDGDVGDRVLETLLSPGEFPGRVFVHLSTGDEAAYALDSSLGSKEPFAELRPDRLEWPEVAGLDFVVHGEHLKLRPAAPDVNDDLLDEGFDVRWVFEPIGQQFEGMPHFAVRIVEAEVLAAQSGRRLMFWTEEPGRPVCIVKPNRGHPNCDFEGLGLETKAVSVSPNGKLAAIVMGGIKPRIEVYDITREPKLVWQSLFPLSSGGAVETAFSADGKWVVALTGRGEMHRFKSTSGEDHMAIPSSGRAARSVPPGEVMAVGGDGGEVTFWYLSDGTIFWRLPAREVRGAVDRLAASGDGNRFATLEYDKSNSVVRVWTVRRRSMLAEIEVDPYAVVDIALDGDGETLYVTHEKKGLLSTTVKKNAVLVEQGLDTSQCKGRLQWIDRLNILLCSTSNGEIRVDSSGSKKGELNTGIESSDWIFGASGDGRRLVAVGAGHLLTWQTD